MKTNTAKLPLIVELEKLFSAVNESFYDGKLKTPTFTLQPERKLAFQFYGDTFAFIVGGKFEEIEDVTGLYQEFLHETVHVYLASVGKKTGTYHNKEFLKVALSVGFYCARDNSTGWRLTTFSEPDETDAEFTAPDPKKVVSRESFFDEYEFDETIFTEAKTQIAELRVSSGRSKQYFLKYVCACDGPHNSIRSGRRPDSKNPVVAFCGTCGYEFLCEESEGENRHISEALEQIPGPKSGR